MKPDGLGSLTAETRKFLPRCCGCLMDFEECAGVQRFPCGHVYCAACLSKLKVHDNVFQCLYDKDLTRSELLFALSDSLAALSSSPGIPQSIHFLLPPPNLTKVPCRDLYTTGMCGAASDCAYSHSGASIEIARKFQHLEVDSTCWECSNCLLVVSKKLMQCPVCEMKQLKEAAHAKVVNAGDNKEMQNVINQTFDQSVQTEADRPLLRPLHLPAGIDRPFEPEDNLLILPKRSPCCTLQ